MPLEPATPPYKAAIDGFIADVQKLMREKLVGLGDYHNLGDIEAEIDRCSLRIELLGTDPEFQESVKKLDAKRVDLARKRDQIKPFLLKLERELAIYRGALASGEPELALGMAIGEAVEEPTVPMQPIAPPMPAPAAFAPAPAPARVPVPVPAPAPAPAPAFQPARAPAPMPHSFQPAPPAPAGPSRPPMPPPMQAAPAPAPAPVVQVEEDLLLAGPELDMSLPPEDPMDDVNFLSAPSDFLADAASTNQGDFTGGPELTLDTIPSALPPAAAPAPVVAAPPSPGAQWPPPGQAIPDPFAGFQGGRPAGAPQAPQAPPRPAPAPAAPQARPAGPAPAPAAPRPAAPPAAGAAAAKPGVKPPWVK